MKGKNNQLVSVIVPVYNVCQYLEKCIESICAQSYENLEIILVDDGSTDSSGNICEKFAIQDRRIKVFHIENQGVSVARNVALDFCHGDYISFVDSDDWLEKDFIAMALETIQEYDADIYASGFYRAYNSVKKLPCTLDQYKVYDGVGFLDDFLTQPVSKQLICWCVWGKVFRRHLWSEVRFNKNLKIGEDALALCDVLKLSRKIIYTNHLNYNYYYRVTSAINTKSVKNIKDANLLFKLLYTDSFWKNSKVFNKIANKYYVSTVYSFLQLTMHPLEPQFMRSMQATIYKNIIMILKAEWKVQGLYGILKTVFACFPIGVISYIMNCSRKCSKCFK